MSSARSMYLAKKAGKGAIHKGFTQPQLTMMQKKKAKMTQAQDDAWDKKHHIKEGSKADRIQDAKNGIKDKSVKKKSMSGPIKHTGTFHGKSNALGHGGRAAQLKARGVPGYVIGSIARREGAAPGGPNYHGKRGK